MRTGQLVGMEAWCAGSTLRWAWSPQQFIPVAEDTGMIVAIEWVMLEACREAPALA